MNEQIRTGRNRTILLSISILMVSIFTIYFYHSVRPEIETKKLVQQIIRFLLTVGLLIAIYQGVKWAKTVAIVLFSLAIAGALFGVISVESALVNKVPLLVMIFVYSMAVYHFGFSKSYQAFFNEQNGKR